MSNLAQRLLTFFVVVPALILLIVFVPFQNHLVINILMFVSSFGLAFESAKVVGLFPIPPTWSATSRNLRLVSIGLIGTAAPIIALLYSLGIVEKEIVPAIIAFLILSLFSVQVLHTQKANPDENTLEQILRYVFILVYPGSGLAFISLITMVPQPDSTYLLLAFLGTVFINDSAAYVFGRLFGRFSYHPFKISPNKTLIGFIGGFSASVLVMYITFVLRPGIFPGGLWSALLIGGITGLGVITGDLFESALKRSSGLKDSGSVIPGRGGLLDSLDSLVFTAPLFYYLYIITQRPWLLG